MKWHKSWSLLALAVLLVGLVPALAVTASMTDWNKVDPALLERLETEEEGEFYVILTVQADLSAAAGLPTKVQKTSYVFEQLMRTARATQRPLLEYLRAEGIPHKSMYIQNMVRVESAGLDTVAWMAARPDVARIVSPPDPRLDPVYEAMEPAERFAAIEWNVLRVHAPDVWAMGYRGEGMVVASNDTGVEYTHPALVNQYRGNLGGGNFDHNYNWWDAWGGSPSPVPVDYDGHGTHTVGTMVGDDGADNQIGVAPGAQWIACAGLNLECLEFFLAPWDLNGQNPDPAKAPDAINNSWYDPSGFDYRPIIQALNAAGVAVIKSAGNAGPDCSTITNPGYVPEIIATAAFAQGDTIASFSSRGPTDNYGETILKPEVAAPGVNVRSSVPGDTYGFKSGTSMAAPHTTALIALMWNAAPCLQGDVPTTKDLMMWTAEAVIDPQCPPFVDHPNDVWGWGILDDQAAVQAAIGYCGGLGYLEGFVDDIATDLRIEGANVWAEREGGGTRSTETDATGYYTMSMIGGTYTVTANAYGYFPETVTGVEVFTDQVTTQNFSLTAMPEHVVSGTVSEAGSGMPLYAQIEVLDTPEAPVWTDPATGFYSITVTSGTYTFRASAALHLREERVVVVDQDQTQNFALEPLACILLVDDDGDDPDVLAYYTDALDDLGLDYDIWDVGSEGDPGENDLMGYRMVLWFTGYPWGNTFNGDNEAAVVAYLDAGGTFFLSSQDYLYDFGLTPFGQNYLHIASFESDVGQNTVTGDNPYAGLGPYSLSYPFTNYSDRVTPDGQGMLAFDGDQGDAAVAYDGGSFQTIFLGFPFEAIPNLADRSDVMSATMAFFGGCQCNPVSEADFDWTPITPTVGEEVTFNGTASGTLPIGFAWDLGDGSSDAGVTVTHTYAAPGTYTVVMTATNCQTGTVTVSHTLTVVEQPCDPVEFVTVTTDISGCVVSFMPEVTGTEPFTWLWVFGDGITSTEAMPVHDYGSSGTYTVTAHVWNCEGSGFDIYSFLVTVDCTVCDPVEILSVTTAISGCVVDFGAEITGTAPFTYLWSFGDGMTSTMEMLSHDYGASGTYTGTLEAWNCEGAGYDSSPFVVTVDCAPACEPVDVLTITTAISGCIVDFGAEVTGTAPFTYLWSFGDGMTSTAEMPVYDYGASGTYTGTLEAWNCGDGYDSEPFVVTVSCELPPEEYTIYLPLVTKGYGP